MQFKQPIGELISYVLKIYLLTGMVERSGCFLRPAIQYDYLLMYSKFNRSNCCQHQHLLLRSTIKFVQLQQPISISTLQTH